MIAILKYNAGNLASIDNAVKKLGYPVVVTNEAAALKSAEKVIFPGVGHAASTMKFLLERNLDQTIRSLTQPVLGICLGMQLLCEFSEEGNTKGLGIFQTQVKRFPLPGPVPHNGWNDFASLEGDLFKGLQPSDNCYFIHAYYAELCQETIATTDYILPFSAALQKDNFYATQFHPEKSSGRGLQILKNFLEL